MTDDIDRSDELRDWYAEDDPDGDDLLDDLLDALRRYVVLDPHAAVGATLWIAATHALPAFDYAPRLAIVSPQKRCGKTRLLDVIEHTAHNPLATSNATVAALFRSIGGGHPPTLIFDEADTVFGSKKVAEQNEDLRNLFNNGFQRGRETLRCVGPNQVPTKFPIFAMAALAGIGTLPDTITDRAVNITMRRRAPGETVKPFRLRRDGPKLTGLRQRLAQWAASHLDALTGAEPVMPVEDREADTWEPLIAVADAAGGRWPELARAACKALTESAAAADEAASLGAQLLADIRDVFTEHRVAFMATVDLVTALRKRDESPWDDYDLNARKLASRLRPFGVKPGHNSSKTARGYSREGLSDAFARYLRPKPSDPSGTTDDQHERWDGSKPPDGSIRPDGADPDGSIRPDETTRPTETAAQGTFWTDWTGPDATPGGNGERYYCECGHELTATESIRRGNCAECFLTAKRGDR